MDLIERYLNEVKFWLPGSQREDVIQELGEDLRSQVEEKESALGRALTETEVADILKQRGQPMSVALRYLPIQHVVGPVFFPLYLNILRVSLGGLAIAHCVLAVLRVLQGSRPVQGLLGAVPNFLWSAIFAVGLLTIVFVVFEYFQVRLNIINDWKPQNLPAVEDKARISRTCSAFELIFTLVFLAWWIGGTPPFTGFTGVPVKAFNWTEVPVWKHFSQTYYVQFIALSLAGLVLTCVNLVSPVWTKPRLAIRMILDILIAFLFFTIVNHHWLEVKAQWLQVTGPHRGLDGRQMASTWTNIGTYMGMSAAALATTGSAIKSAFRIARW